MLLLLATAITADEYTDPLTGLVYAYEKGSGVAKVTTIVRPPSSS